VTRRVEISSLLGYGVGLTRSHKILAKGPCVSPDIPRQGIFEDGDIQKAAVPPPNSFTLEAICRRQEGHGPQASQDIACGARSSPRMGLPVRGQRTRTNARNPPGVLANRGRQENKAVPLMPALAAAAGFSFPYPRPRSMAKASQENRRQKKPSATSPMALLTSRAPSTTPSCRSPTRAGEVDLLVVGWCQRVQGRSQGPLSLRRRRRSPADAAPSDQGMRQIEVLVQGPRLRPGKPRSVALQGGRSGITLIRDVTPMRTPAAAVSRAPGLSRRFH